MMKITIKRMIANSKSFISFESPFTKQGITTEDFEKYLLEIKEMRYIVSKINLTDDIITLIIDMDIKTNWKQIEDLVISHISDAYFRFKGIAKERSKLEPIKEIQLDPTVLEENNSKNKRTKKIDKMV